MRTVVANLGVWYVESFVGFKKCMERGTKMDGN